MIDVYEHCADLKEYEKSLIQIPHTLESIGKNENFKNIFTFETPFKGLKNFFNIFKVKKIEKKIQKKLDINENDILFVYTEYEILNQYIISLFKKRGAKVYVIEDGGFPTYLTYGVKTDNNLPLKKKVKLFYTKFILGYSFVEYLYYNNLVFPQINEKYIDGVLLYLNVSIVRNIKKYLIQKNTKQLYLDSNKAIFLNEKMYDYYCTSKEYENILEDILWNLSKKFKKVYFKFHPRETKKSKEWQLKIISKFNNVEIIQESQPIEQLLEQYNSKYVFSFLSAALLNVNAMGAIPVYVYHQYEDILKNSVFKQIELILRNTNYKFLSSYNNFENIGFQSNKKSNKKLNTII